MAEAELLQQNNTLPAIDREQLLKDSQNREFNRLLGTLESDRFSLLDLEDLLINIGKTNPKAIPYIQEYKANFNTGLEQILVKSGVGKSETQSKPKEKAKVGTEKVSENPNITLTQEKQDGLVKSGENEIKAKEQELKQLEQKLIQINLISQVASMYKEYLQSIMEAIKFKSVPDLFSRSPNMFKDERYAGQIKVIGEKVRFLDNLVSFLSTLGNYNEVKSIDLNKIVNQLFVSEKELSQNGFMSQPFINGILHKEARVSGANQGYEDIKKMLLTPNLNREQAEKIKVSVFEKIRQFDKLGNDDNGLVLDSGEAISARITPNILENRKLRERPDINDVFTSLESFGNDKKEELLKSLSNGKTGLREFVNGTGLLDKLGFKSEKSKTSFIDSLYKNLKENLGKIDDTKIKDELKSKIIEQFDFQKERLPKEKQAELDDKRKEALSDEKISLGVKELKQELTFMTFGKAFMNKVLDNNSKFVEEVGKTDSTVNLYRDIEGIGDKMSDKTFNNISVGTQFLTEQIAIMLVSGVIGGVVAKGGGLLIGKIAPATQNLPGALKWSAGTMVEGTGFYFGYTGINGAVHEGQVKDIMKNYSHYDLARTIVFLGVLRSLPLDKAKDFTNMQSSFLNESKNITLDTTAILGTDIVIRGASLLLTGKEGFKTDVDGKLTIESARDFLVEELTFIVPLIIGLRQSDKAVASLFENGKKPEITVTATENEFIIQIEGLKKEIRALRQQRNSLRNKGKSSKEVTEALKVKKREYKQMRDENADILAKSGTGNTDTPTAVLPNQNQPQNNKDTSRQAKDTNNQKDNVNMNTGIRTIQDVLSGRNIEDVMKGFDETKKGLSEKFQELLKNGGDRVKAKELIGREVDNKVQVLAENGIKVDGIEEEGFIRQFKEERLAEFDKLIEIKEKGGSIPDKIDMQIYGMKPWKLELRDVKGMDEFFTIYIEKMKIMNGDKNRSKDNL